jgi:superfamily II DNA helicase RecQ
VCEAWLEKKKQVLRRLAVLVHVNGGKPPRWTEQAVTAYCNGKSNPRSIFVLQGHACIVSTYNKTDAVSIYPKLIARFLPHRVGQLLLAYIADVIPFERYIGDCLGEAPDEPKFTTCLLWHTDGKAWDTRTFTDLIGEETQRGLGTALNTNSWRHLITAIGRDFLQPDAASDMFAENSARQAGHSLETEMIHYAVDGNMPSGLNNVTLRRFFDTSKSFWKVMGMDAQSSEKGLKKGTRKKLAPKSRLHDQEPGQEHRLQDNIQAIHAELQQLRADLVRQPSGPLHGMGLTSDNDTDGSEGTAITTGHGVRHQGVHTGDEVPTAPGSMAKRIGEQLRLMYGSSEFRSAEIESAVKIVATTNDDVVVQLPCGSGKSLAITIPAALSQELATVVFVPFTALRDGFRDQCQRVGIHAEVWSEGLIGQVPVVIACPEALGDNDENWSRFQSYLKDLLRRGKVRRIVLDEAHLLVLDRHWRKAYDTVADLLHSAKAHNVQRVFLSATLPRPFMDMLGRLTGLEPGYRYIYRSCNIPSIYHEVAEVSDKMLAIRLLVECWNTDNAIGCRYVIFTRGTLEAEEVARCLDLPYFHAGTAPKEKERIYNGLENRTIAGVVATTALGSGVNLPFQNVAFYGRPYGLTNYLQMAHRGGRDGSPSASVIVLDKNDLKPQHGGDEEKNAESAGDKQALAAYLNTKGCRRSQIVGYFDGDMGRTCGGADVPCDNCSRRPIVDKATLANIRPEQAGDHTFQRSQARKRKPDEASNGHADLPSEAGTGRDISDPETPIVSHPFYSSSPPSLGTKGDTSNGILPAPGSALVPRGIRDMGPMTDKAPLKRQRLTSSSSISSSGSMFETGACSGPLSSPTTLPSSVSSPPTIRGSGFNARDSFRLKDKLDMPNQCNPEIGGEDSHAAVKIFLENDSNLVECYKVAGQDFEESLNPNNRQKILFCWLCYQNQQPRPWHAFWQCDHKRQRLERSRWFANNILEVREQRTAGRAFRELMPKQAGFCFFCSGPKNPTHDGVDTAQFGCPYDFFKEAALLYLHSPACFKIAQLYGFREGMIEREVKDWLREKDSQLPTAWLRVHRFVVHVLISVVIKKGPRS